MASGESDDRPPTGQTFDWGDSEVFFTGQEKRLGTTIEVTQLRVGAGTQELDIRTGVGFEALPLRSDAGDLQRHPCDLARVNGEIDPFVWH